MAEPPPVSLGQASALHFHQLADIPLGALYQMDGSGLSRHNRATPAALAGRGWGILAGAAYGSHLMVDLLDDRGQTNVLLGWPLTDSRPDAMARVFPTVPLTQGDGLLGALTSLLEPDTLLALLHQTAVGALFFVVLVAWAQGMVLLSKVRE